MDSQVRYRQKLFMRWLTGSHSLTELAVENEVNRRTLVRWFMPLWTQNKPFTALTPEPFTIYVNEDASVGNGDQSTTGRKRTWWYTHRNLRAARSLIRNALPHLFTFVRYPQIPRTTNHVEGGINSRLKELIHRHRGLSQDRKQVLVAQHLAQKNRQKPPRNVT
jgi:hypothetical protein